MAVIAWTEIVGFANIRKFMQAYPENLNGNSVVSYRSKVKLHGSNCAVQIHADGSIVCQSRTSILTPEDDYAGFAKWAKHNEAAWKDSRDNARASVIVYGEWVGPGIQKGVAVSEIPKKCFAVFAARPLDSNNLPLEDILWIEPEVLEKVVAGIPDTYVLPWHNPEIEIGWQDHNFTLQVAAGLVNQWVNEVEVNDPWVDATFGVKGTGEGLVFYPVSNEHLGVVNFKNLVFKAKGEAHKNIKTAKPAQISAEIANSISDFANLVLTSARLEQGAKAIGTEFNIKLTGQFVNWILKDVEKESQDELEASSMTWKQVQKIVSDQARSWYMKQAKT